MNPIRRAIHQATMPLRRRRMARTELGRLVLQHRNEINQIAARRGFTNVRVFGSMARGDTHDGSDVDLLVDEVEKVSLWDLGGLTLDMQDVLGVEVDIGPAADLKPEIKDQANREAVRL